MRPDTPESRPGCASGGMLDVFRAEKEREVALLREREREGSFPAPLTAPRPSFRAALLAPHPGILPIIAEYKRASPSRGDIRLDLSPEDVARRYAGAGAACISVLTEASRFKGEPGFLARMAPAGPPLLRKDFILHPLQVRATAATPASALLLIVRLTPDARTLRALREEAESFGMDAVVEIFNAEDLALARESGARLIQANARDLDTLHVDREACLSLGAARRDGELWIAASGMSEPAHLQRAAEAGFNAALIGSGLMAEGDPGAALARLTGASREPGKSGDRP